MKKYKRKSSLWDTHLSTIRHLTEFRPCQEGDHPEIIHWLVDAAKNHPTRSKMFAAAIDRCRQLRLELPTEKKLQRIVSSAWQQYLNATCQMITDRLSPEQKERINNCLKSEVNARDSYEGIKKNPGKFGLKTLLNEISRLQIINSFKISAECHLQDIPEEVLKLLRERAAPEGSFQMKRHPLNIRYAFLAVLFHFRRMELTDNIVDIFLELIHRIDKKADRKLEHDLVSNIQSVYKKREILYKLAKASTQNPDGIVKSVVFSVIGEDVLQQIITEYEGKELNYDSHRAQEKTGKYIHSHRRMMKPVLDILVFRTNNPVRNPLIKNISVVHKYLDKRHTWIPQSEKILEDLPADCWKELEIDNQGTTPRISKHHFELWVLQKLEKAIRNKEIWVEGSYRYRDPDQDLPQDWAKIWITYCDKHKIPPKGGRLH
jgi:hypothetical protein